LQGINLSRCERKVIGAVIVVDTGGKTALL